MFQTTLLKQSLPRTQNNFIAIKAKVIYNIIMARPKSEVDYHRIGVQIELSEYELFKSEAEARNLTFTDYLRQSLALRRLIDVVIENGGDMRLEHQDLQHGPLLLGGVDRLIRAANHITEQH
jgi:hypothetical protein